MSDFTPAVRLDAVFISDRSGPQDRYHSLPVVGWVGTDPQVLSDDGKRLVSAHSFENFVRLQDADPNWGGDHVTALLPASGYEVVLPVSDGDESVEPVVGFAVWLLGEITPVTAHGGEVGVYLPGDRAAYNYSVRHSGRDGEQE